MHCSLEFLCKFQGKILPSYLYLFSHLNLALVFLRVFLGTFKHFYCILPQVSLCGTALNLALHHS
jgi:hypothetical protein